jgi:hypothetical protein
MGAQKTTTQKEIDIALKAFGITPTDGCTADKTQRLYEDAEGKGLFLPNSETGFSGHTVESILQRAKRILQDRETVGNHAFTAKPVFKVIEDK